jgi:hypothetical protein
MQIRKIVIAEFPVGTKYQEYVNGQPTEQVSIKSTEEFMGEQWISLTNGRRYHPNELRESLATGREVSGSIVSHKRLGTGSGSGGKKSWWQRLFG